MSTPSTSPMKDFISATLSDIQAGLPKNARIEKSVRFEMTTVSQNSGGGKINVGVLDWGVGGGVNVSDSQTQKISFEIEFPNDSKLASEAAIKSKAEADKAQNDVIAEKWKRSGVAAATK